MRLAIIIIVFHILLGRKLCLCREREALRAGVFKDGSCVQGEDVGLSILLNTKCEFHDELSSVAGIAGGEGSERLGK